MRSCKILSYSGNFLLILLLFVNGFAAGYALQTDTLAVEKNKINHSDSSKVQQDSLLLSNPLVQHGQILLTSENYSSYCIGKEDILFDRYRGLNDIIAINTGFYPMSLGGFGYMNSFSSFGSSIRDISVNYNGRSINDIQFGSYNTDEFSPEFFEKAEILTGSDAVIFADNSSGMLLNLQEIRYNTAVPYTRLWFHEGPNEEIAADGIFSQNFMPNYNFTFGFRALSGNGQYTNSEIDHWNVRGILRWNPDDLSSLSVTENFTNHSVGINGGIDRQNSSGEDGTTELFSNLYAVPYFTQLGERVIKHDITALYSSYLTGDSMTAVSIAGYYSHSNWDFSSRKGHFLPDSSQDYLDTNYNVVRTGIKGQFEQNLNNVLQLSAGGEFFWETVPRSLFMKEYEGAGFAGFSRAELSPLSWINLSAGIRILNRYDRGAFSFGAKMLLRFSDKFSITADFSRSERLPGPSEGLNLAKESHSLAIAGANYGDSVFSLSINAYARHIDLPIVFLPVYNSEGKPYTAVAQNIDSRLVFGGDLSAKAALSDNLHVKLKAQYTVSYSDEEEDNRFPALMSSLDSYYQFTSGRSILRLGISYQVLTSFIGETFSPLTRAYYSYDYFSGFMHSGGELYASARLGSAFLRVGFQNLLGSGYYYVPVYPNPDRYFYMTVSWHFLD